MKENIKQSPTTILQDFRCKQVSSSNPMFVHLDKCMVRISIYEFKCEDNNRYSLKKEQKSLEEELILFGLDGSLAYDNSFAKAYKDGLIVINREKLDD